MQKGRPVCHGPLRNPSRKQREVVCKCRGARRREDSKTRVQRACKGSRRGSKTASRKECPSLSRGLCRQSPCQASNAQVQIPRNRKEAKQGLKRSWSGRKASKTKQDHEGKREEQRQGKHEPNNSCRRHENRRMQAVNNLITLPHPQPNKHHPTKKKKKKNSSRAARQPPSNRRTIASLLGLPSSRTRSLGKFGARAWVILAVCKH